MATMRAMSLLFPGQGSQTAGMGRDVADADKDAMELWKKAEAISGLPLREICWDGDEKAMSDTRILQQASRHIRPSACAGHSLGEYSALAASGVLDAESTLKLVSLRGALMAESDPDGKGAMAAIVKLPLEKVEEIVTSVARETGLALIVANYNTPGQYVISGDKAAVDMAGARAKEIKGRALPLAVSGAFHSPLMKEAADQLAAHMRKVVWHKPVCPVYSNVTACGLTDGESIRDAMLSQMTSSVRWIDIIRAQYADGQRAFLEIGPKAVLSKMTGRILDDVPAEEYTSSLVSTLAQCEELA